MSAAIWASWGETWELDEKVSFNGVTKLIMVNAGVTALNIRADVYSAWVRWFERDGNSRYLPAMRFSGADPIPGGETGVTFFTTNGWKLCYDANAVSVSGALYSEDYGTAFWSLDGVDPIYPATVSALVSSAVSYQNVIVATKEDIAAQVWVSAPPIATDAPTPQENATAVWASILESGISAAELMRLTAAFISGDGANLESSSPQFKSLDGSKVRLQATYNNGTRTVTTRDGA